MAENNLSKKKKNDIAGKKVSDLPGQCDVSVKQKSTSLIPPVVNSTYSKTAAFTDNLMKNQSQSLLSKRKKQNDYEASTDIAVFLTSESTSTDENPTASIGLKNTLHGNIFQLKLLMLFLIRGIGSDYQFHLGSEIPGMGGKFDDLIFKFNVMKDDEAIGDKRSERYRYLQAKHKQNEESEKITAADLLNDNNGEFSLPKYFRSYYGDIIQITEGILPENVHDCIICTNIGFDSDEKLKNSGIELIGLEDKDNILTFVKVSSTKKTPTRYKLRKTEKLHRKMTEWSDIHLLAKTLLEYATDNTKLTLSSPIFKRYHFALIDEKVIDKKSGKLCATFLEENSRFRDILSELTFIHYWEKLKFKCDDKKKIRVDCSKKLPHFDETLLRKRLPKYSQAMDFCIFEDFYDDLIAKNIIDSQWRKAKTKKFTDNFIHGINIAQEGLEFRRKLRNIVFIHYWKDLTIQLSGSFGRKIISSTPDENKSLNDLIDDKDIDDFLDKLVFAVHTPNEIELDDILKTEVSDRYNLHESDFQSDFLLKTMLDWFKKKESKFMESKEGMDIIENGRKKMESLRVTAISIDYQKQLKEVLEFNEKAIEKMKEKLKQLLISSNRIGHISTPLPERTAVKVIAALEKLKSEQPTTNKEIPKEYFRYEDSYLVTSSRRLQKNYSKFKKALKSERSHNLLVVVCENGASMEKEEFYEKIVKKIQNKRLLIISQNGAKLKDKLNFGDLNDKSKRALLEKEVAFQDSLLSVGDLLKRSDTTMDDLIENGGVEEVLDFDSIEELMMKAERITIPTCSSARFEPYLYIERQLEFPWESHFYDQLADSMKCTAEKLQKECVVDSHGNIEWFAKDHLKEKIWEKMKSIIKENGSSLSSNGVVSSEENFINNENKKRRVVIISGLAGTGKSTILSNYYEKIKRGNPDIWVIRIDLVDYRKDLAEFNFSPINQSSAITFFVNRFANHSPFARSLLTHRFQTDGRIVVMLDGLDEIDGKLQEKMFRLVTAIRLTKLDALYITTRSHLKKEMQDKLFQFPYALKNFSQKDQVNCLSMYWESKLEMTSVQYESIQLFGKSLVTRLLATLNERERDFIGIPLQCRMLAECFETQLQNTIQQGLPVDFLIENISNDLDLTSLYSLLMKKKLEIYRQEKFKVDTYNHQANWIIENTMRNLETYLRKLAIKTIVFYPKYVDVLLDQSSFQSKQEISQEEEDYTGGGVCFGFLDKNDKGEVKFVHRTYGEYLFAKYLHGGFLPEKDKNCNNLLTSDPVRKIVFKTILEYERYGGVRVFLNSMLKECVPIAHLYREIEKSPKILSVAIHDKNAYIFKFMCDCLDISLQKVYIRQILNIVVFDHIRGWSFSDSLSDCLYENSKIFERFISYYDEEADKTEVQGILNIMLYKPLQTWKHFEKNQEEIKKPTELVLDFLGRNREALRQISGTNFKEISYILTAFSNRKYYKNVLNTYIELLSSIYPEDILFKNVLVDAFQNLHRNIPYANVKTILTTLRGLGRNQVLNDLSFQILKIDVELFKKFHQPEKEESNHEGVLLQTIIQSLLVRDSQRMTRLHRAALYDNEETVVRILETVHTSYFSLDTDQECKIKTEEVVYKVIARDEEGVTPLYVAAACERKNICQQMLIFLKEILSKDELREYLTETNGFLCNALWDAIKWEKTQMFRIILESVKKILGSDYLMALLKAPIPEEKPVYRLVYYNMFYRCCTNIILFKIVVDVIVGDETKGYEQLYDLLFEDKKLTTFLHVQFYHIDNKILQRMLSVNGLENWMKRLLDIDLDRGLFLMSGNFLVKLTVDQCSSLLRMIISVDYGTSYLDQWFEVKIFSEENDGNNYLITLEQIFKRISDILGQSVIEEFIVRKNYQLMKRALLYRGKSLVDVMLTFLSNNTKNMIVQHFVNMLHQQILEAMVNYDRPLNPCSIHNIIHLVFDYVDSCDLSQLVDLISYNYIYNDSLERTHSIWSDYVDIKDKKHAKNVLQNIDKFFKCVLDNLGQSVIEKLVVEHEDGQIITRLLTCTRFSKYFDDENLADALVNAFLRHLAKEKREEIERKLVKDAPAKIKNFIYTNRAEYAELYWMNILHPQYLVKYADGVALLKLIKIITQRCIYDCNRETEISVWSSYLCYDDHSYLWKYDQDLLTKNVDKFLQCVSKKLSKSKVKELVLHDYHDEVSVIGRAAHYRKKDLVEAMLAHLTEEDREEVRRYHVDTAVEMNEQSLPSDQSNDEDSG